MIDELAIVPVIMLPYTTKWQEVKICLGNTIHSMHLPTLPLIHMPFT